MISRFFKMWAPGCTVKLSYSPHVRNDLIQLFLGHTLPGCDRWTYPVTSRSIAQCTSFDDTKEEVYKLCPSHTQPGHWLGTPSLRRAHDLQLTPHLNWRMETIQVQASVHLPPYVPSRLVHIVRLCRDLLTALTRSSKLVDFTNFLEYSGNFLILLYWFALNYINNIKSM